MRRVILLGGVASANVTLGFLYQWYIFTRLGPGRATDALFAAMVIPNLVLAVASGSLMHVLVPLLSTQRAENFRRDAWTFFQLIGAGFSFVAVPLILLAPYWVPLTVPGFEPAAAELAIRLVRIQLLGMVFAAVSGVLWAAYHARQRFFWAEVSPVITAVVTFPFLVWALPRYGAVAAAWALLIRQGIQVLLLLPGMGAYHLPRLRTGTVEEAWRRIRPLLAGTAYYKTDQLVDRFLASMAPPGQLSLLHLGTQLYGAGHTVLNTAIAAPMVPQLAHRVHTGDWNDFRRISRQHLGLILGLTGLAFIAIILIGRPVLALLFGHGRFSAGEVGQLWILLLALGGTWLGGAAGQILSTSFYARGDTRTPTRVGVAGYTLGVILKVIGFRFLGVIGIALGTSIYLLLNAGVMQILLSRHLRAAVTQPSQAAMAAVADPYVGENAGAEQ